MRTLDWRIDIRTEQRDEARRVACEQFTRANKLERAHVEIFDTLQELYSRATSAEDEREGANAEWAKMKEERDKELARRELWMGIARKCFHNAGKEYRRAKAAERERDDYIKQLDNMCDEHCIVDVLKRERDEAEMLLDEVLEALRIRYELCAKAESERDELQESIRRYLDDIESLKSQNYELWVNNAKLVAALKEITLINAEYDTVPNSVLRVIDAALDGALKNYERE